MQMRAKTERILAAMLNTEKLEAMSERALASEYKKVMGKGPERIKESAKAERIAEMVAKLRASAAKSSDGDAPATKAPKEKKVKAPKEPKPAKEKKPKPAKETKPPKEKKAAKTPSKRAPKEAGDGPFRAGTMKAKGYEFFLTHQDDAEACRAHVEKLGAAPATARGWISTYRKHAGK
jgi:outer membrane biosynthesis protein TonB